MDSIQDKRMIEQLRQEQETFNQHKAHENRWFYLRLAIGSMSIIVLPSILAISAYILLKYDSFPAAVVTIAAATLLTDALALLGSLWQIAFKADFITKLAPVTQIQLSDVPDYDKKVSYSTNVLQEGFIIHSATYGRGNKTVDVTNVLRSKVKARLKMTILNEELDIEDPVPTVRKKLKIVYSYAGKTYTEEFNEGEGLLLPRDSQVIE